MRALRIFSSALLAVCCCGGIQAAQKDSRTETIRAKLLSNDRNYVFVAMHRGDWRNYPENSRDAIRSAIALGADIVELDARMTKDGRFVLLHDESLDRTTDGHGKVSEHTFAEVKALHLKKGTVGTGPGGVNANNCRCALRGNDITPSQVSHGGGFRLAYFIGL